MHKTIKY